MAGANPTTIDGNILIDILTGDISTNTLTTTIQGFLLSGSLTTASGIGDNVGEVGVNIVSGTSYTATNGTYTNLETFSAGGGTGMTVNVTVNASTVTVMQIVNGGSGYSVGDFIGVKEATLLAAGSSITNGTLTSRSLTAADLTGGGTPYMLNFNPSPVSSSFEVVPDSQKLLIGGPQLALYHAYNTTVSQSLFNTNLPQTSDNNKGAGTLLWTTSGSDPANSNNYMTWAPDGSDAQSYQDTNIPFKLERGDVIRVEGIKNITDPDTNSSSSINIEEDFIVEGIVPYYYSSSFDDNQQNRNSLSGFIQRVGTNINENLLGEDPFDPNNPNGIGGNFSTAGNSYTFTTFVGGLTRANGNPGRINTFNNLTSTGANYNVGQVYTLSDGAGTGATFKVLSVVGPDRVATGVIDNPGTGYELGDTLRITGGGSSGLQTIDVFSFLDVGCTIKRNGVTLTDWNGGASSPGGGGKIEIVSDSAAGYFPGFISVTLSEGSGFQIGDQIIITQAQSSIAGQWFPNNFAPNLPTSSPSTAALAITLANPVLGSLTFNNNFTVGVNVNVSEEGTPGAAVPSGSQVGYHLYEEGEVALTADTFVQVTPDPNVTLNGLLLGEVKKFTVRRQIEADDKVMLKNINPPSGSLGIETLSGQGFLIPNDFSEVQKSNALNIINQLRAKNAFNKPIEPGITDGGNRIIVQGSGSDTVINIP